MVNFKEDEQLKTLNHSCAHLMAQAIKHLYPQAKFWVGPVVAEGFYYDVDLGDDVIRDEDIPKIEKEMKKICKENLAIKPFILPRDEAVKLMEERQEHYKIEHMADLADETEFSFFQQGEYVDMCIGPHLTYTKALKAFKITQQSGAYWKNDKENKMLTRINGVAFHNQEELDAWEKQQQEARERDHRKIGKEMRLFMTDDLVGRGLPMFLPAGYTVWQELENYIKEKERARGYLHVMTPCIGTVNLYKTSGHWDHYKQNMYTTVIDEEDYAIKPMNCPGGMLVYASEPHSYRELPLRVGELGLVHRHELSGALHGLFRVRCFTQDDAHIFMTQEQLKDEIKNVVKLFDEVYSVFGLPYKIELSTMPEDHIGTREDWEKAENALADAITSIGKEYVVNPGDGAFYGPKLDFHIQDSLGRTWQCGTIQLDYQLPGRFDLEYTTSDGGKDVPVMIHRVVFGSIERFIGIITEHFAGAFPAWLAPVQVKILPVTDRALDYAKDLSDALDGQGFRVEVDDRNEKIGKKIREATLEKVPYMIVVGDRDMENKTVSVRTRAGEDLGAMSLEDFTAKLKEVVDSKAIQ